MNSSPRRFTTFCSIWSVPRTSSKGVREMSRACFSKRGGVMTTFSIPVSSSSVRKTKPLAVPGRWRQITSPATPTRAPSFCRVVSRAVSTPLGTSSGRRCRMGWPFNERPVIR